LNICTSEPPNCLGWAGSRSRHLPVLADTWRVTGVAGAVDVEAEAETGTGAAIGVLAWCSVSTIYNGNPIAMLILRMLKTISLHGIARLL